MKMHLRLHRPDRPGELVTFDLPPPAQAGIAADDWAGISVSAALQYLQREVDPALGYALSCRRGLCNICAMKIDGEVVTACTTPMHDGILVEPARDSLALRDTVVELSLVRRARVLSPSEQAAQKEHADAR